MKKKVIAIVCAVAVLAAAGGGVTWHFLGNGTKEDDNVVYVNTVKALTNLGTGNGMENRYAGGRAAGTACNRKERLGGFASP